jgi:hypothetical protein
MRSVRSLLVAGAAIVALAVVAPSAAASTAKPFHVAKDCEVPTCVITSSTFKGIPVDSVITYAMNEDGSLTATISGAHGTATGRCDLSNVFSGSGPGSCVFSSGTGSLTQFHLDVDVTTTNFVTWYWDGTYWMGGG